MKRLIAKFKRDNLLEIDYQILGSLGFTPDLLMNVKSFLIFFLCCFLEIFPGLYFIIKHADDVKAVFMCLHEFASFLVFVLQVFVIFFNRHNLVSLITDLKEAWKCCKFL